MSNSSTNHESTFALSIEHIGPGQARSLAVELQTALEGSGTHAMLRMTSALAAAAVLREPVLFTGIAAFIEARGAHDVRARAIEVAATFVHPASEERRDALTRLVSSALERGLRMAPSSRADRVDPLLHSCTEIVELVNAIAIWRFGIPETPAPADVAPMSDGRRRQTRDFEVSPPGSQRSNEQRYSSEQPREPEPRSGNRPPQPRSTMRPTPNRSTLRPTSLSGADLDKDAVLVPRTQVRDAQGRPLKKKW